MKQFNKQFAHCLPQPLATIRSSAPIVEAMMIKPEKQNTFKLAIGSVLKMVNADKKIEAAKKENRALSLQAVKEREIGNKKGIMRLKADLKQKSNHYFIYKTPE